MYFMDGPWGLHGGLATPSRMVLISKTTHQKDSHLSCSEQAARFFEGFKWQSSMRQRRVRIGTENEYDNFAVF